MNSDNTYLKLKQRGLKDEQIKAAMKDKSFKPVKSLNITFNEPISLHCTYFDYYNSIYSAYLKGHLPFSGSYVEQPGKIIDVINTLDALHAETYKKEHDKQMKELKNNGNKKRKI